MTSRHFAGLSWSRLDPERWAKTKNLILRMAVASCYAMSVSMC